MARLLLVRHGQSTWNADGRWQGQADAPLSELGERQARAAADYLEADGSIGTVWSSDLVRARRTAELIAERLARAVQVDPRRERDAGEWTGLTRDEIEAQYPGDLEARRSPPGFEGDEPLLLRVRAALVELAGRGDPGPVLVLTHGGVVRTVEKELGAPEEPVPNLGGRWVEVHGGELILGERQLLIDPDDVEATVPRSI